MAQVKSIKIDDNDILYVVLLLKLIFGSDKNIRRLLEKIDTPQEIAKVRESVQSLVDLVASI